jgi:hypothetical protein
MATEKISISLRLRHSSQNLSAITAQLGLVAGAGWDKGEPKSTLCGSPQSGKRDESYRTFNLGDATSTEMSGAISECLQRLKPVGHVIRSFVDGGGTASLAIGWFCNSAVEGDRVSRDMLEGMAELSLTLDLYLYLTADSGSVPTDGESNCKLPAVEPISD